jgi:predicted GNAT family acetyltransferase
MAGSAEGMVTLSGTDEDNADADEATTEADAAELSITENSDFGIYEATLGGVSVAGVVYNRTGNRVTLLSTAVFPEFRGRGIAGRLLGGVFDKLRANGETATLRCPFAAEFVEAHPEYADLVDPTVPGTARNRH